MNKRTAGKEYESIAADFLIKQNYEILERNFNVFDKGELDLIARDPNGYLVFVEVKGRENLLYGHPEEAIDHRKAMNIRKMAEHYIYDKELHDVPCRIDVIAILNSPENFEIKHIVDAI